MEMVTLEQYKRRPRHDIFGKCKSNGYYKTMHYAHENQPFPWLSWSVYVPILCLAQRICPCIRILSVMLDIRWWRDVVIWWMTSLLSIMIYSFNNLLILVNIEIVFKSQLYDLISIAKQAFSSLKYRNTTYTIRDFLFKPQMTKSSGKIAHFKDKCARETMSRGTSNTINNKKNNTLLKKFFILLTMINMIQFPSGTVGLRCYTDITASKSNSQECGLNTGCVKIYIDSEDMLYRKQTDMGFGYGYKPGMTYIIVSKFLCIQYNDFVVIVLFTILFISIDYQLPPHFQNNPVIVRGCFVLKVPDRCYTAKNGLSYCWCSTKDLCNSAPSAHKMSLVSNYGQSVIQYLLTWSSYSYIWQNGFTPLTIENEIQLGFQLLLSAFFWYAYNNGIIHQFISKQQPRYIL